MMNGEIFTKYNRGSSRYTCYPTVPYWEMGAFHQKEWFEVLNHQMGQQGSDEIALYIHLPFCDSLCTYCGCTKQVTLQHEREEPYIDALLAEWQIYLQNLTRKPKIKEIHLGGGTPTFFQIDQLKRLMEGLLKDVEVAPNPKFSFEAHPKSTTRKHLSGLYELGFRRLSIGVQEYDKSIQLKLNRVQPIEWVQRVHDYAREIGYTSINHDLIYGLPFQRKDHVLKSVEITAKLNPDRIAFYSYAHVPWRKGVGQKAFQESDMLHGYDKWQLYTIAKEYFNAHGYTPVGIDHFAKENDELFAGRKERRLRRNFNGYSVDQPAVTIGLGVSSISDGKLAYVQNNPVLVEYLNTIINEGRLSLMRAHRLTREDQLYRNTINNLMCYGESELPASLFMDSDRLGVLVEMKQDHLIAFHGYYLRIMEEGEAFTRRICNAIDPNERLSFSKQPVFSQSV